MTTPPQATTARRGWRWLAWFWVVVVLVAVAGGGTLAWLGPPKAVQVAPKPAPAPAAVPKAAKTAAMSPVHAPGSPILPPDPALLAPIPGTTRSLPRIGADGRMPMRVYAAGYDPADPRPRVAILLANIGASTQDSLAAIKALPAAVSLALSPYAAQPQALLARARAAGHELLIGIPMEPQGYTMNDPGPMALMTGLSPAENAQRLERVLSLWNGYAGATGAMGNGLHGERYAASAQMAPLLRELSARGVFYIDPRPDGALPPDVGRLASRAVDLVLDEPPLRANIEARLARLAQLAHDRGSALGLADGPSPVVVARIAAWAAALSRRGLVLVPVSALVSLPKGG